MKKLLRLVLPIACMTVINGNARAQYVSSGPNGGVVNGFYRDNGALYAAGSGGIYRSADDGKSWQEASGSPTAFGCDALYSVAASGPFLFAGSQQSGIFRSLDGGLNWSAASTGLRLGPNAPYTDIEIAGGNVIAVRADSGYLYLSMDQGLSWVRNNLGINNALARYVSVHNNNVYVSTPQGLFSSPNNGMSFTNINPSPADFGELIWSGDTAYVGTATGVRMSLDNGLSFSPAALTGRAVRKLAVMGNAMYAVVRNPAPIQDSVLYSANGGASFSAAPFSSQFRFTTIQDLAATPGGVLVGSDYGLYGTTNGGAGWNLADSGYHATRARGLAVSGAYVYAGTGSMGVFRVMPDSGALRWQHSGDIGHNVEGVINAVAAKGAYVHAGGATNYYRSADSGATWTAGASGAASGNVVSVYTNPANSDVWIVRNGNLFYSGNDGTSFGQVVNSNIPLNGSQYVTRADTALFVAAGSALYKGGSMMSFSPVTGITGRVTAVVYAGNTFYAATDGFGLYSSANGMAWSAVNISSPGTLPAKINTLIADSGGLIAGTDNGFYTNAGGAWAQGGLQDHVVQSLAVRAGKLFAGTCSGVYSIPYKIVVNPPSSVNGLMKESSNMTLFPNPAMGNFFVRLNAARAGRAEVLMRNVMGATVFKQSLVLKAGANELNIAGKAAFGPGVYLVRVTGEDFRASGRIVIQ